MKKLIITMALLTGMVFVSKAQFILRGALITSGSVSMNFSNEKQEFVNGSAEYKHREISINPFLGYFLIDNLALGAGFDFGFRETGESSASNIAVMPMIRYYISEGFFAQGSFGIGSSSTKPFPGIEVKYNTTLWRVGAGYSIRITDTILLDPFVSYGSTVLNHKGDTSFVTKVNQSGFWAGLSFTLIVID